jgi:hypothetical protein
VTAPLVYLVLLAVILCGDVVLASLRFGALLGIPVDGLPIGGSVLDLLTGLLFLAVLATYGCVCWTSPGSPRCAVRTGSQTAGPARRSSAPLGPPRYGAHYNRRPDRGAATSAATSRSTRSGS